MRHYLMVCVLVWASLILGGCGRTTPDTIIPLTVSHHASVELELEEVHKILQGMQDILLQSDCAVGFTLAGPLQVFHQGNGFVHDGAEYLTVLTEAPGEVKVVNKLNYCHLVEGGPAWHAIIGCSPQPGQSIVVAHQALTAFSSVLWLHEYGHNMGLPHREDSDDLVMNSLVNYLKRGVNAEECAQFKRGYQE